MPDLVRASSAARPMFPTIVKPFKLADILTTNGLLGLAMRQAHEWDLDPEWEGCKVISSNDPSGKSLGSRLPDSALASRRGFLAMDRRIRLGRSIPERHGSALGAFGEHC